MIRHLVRIISVALPILLIFLLPLLGVRSGLGWAILIGLLFAFPLFAFEFDTTDGPPKAPAPPRRDEGDADEGPGRRSTENAPAGAISTMNGRRRHVRNGSRLRHHE